MIDKFIADHTVVGDFHSTLADCEQVLELAGQTLSGDPDTITLFVERLRDHGAMLIEDRVSREWYWSGLKLKPGPDQLKRRSEFSVILSCDACGERGRATISENTNYHITDDPEWFVKKIADGFIARKSEASSWSLTILCEKCLKPAWH